MVDIRDTDDEQKKPDVWPRSRSRKQEFGRVRV